MRWNIPITVVLAIIAVFGLHKLRMAWSGMTLLRGPLVKNVQMPGYAWQCMAAVESRTLYCDMPDGSVVCMSLRRGYWIGGTVESMGAELSPFQENSRETAVLKLDWRDAHVDLKEGRLAASAWGWPLPPFWPLYDGTPTAR